MTIPHSPRRRAFHLAKSAAFGLACFLISLWSVGPFLWQLSSSLQPDRALAAATPTFLPLPPTFDHFINIFAERGFHAYIVNSAIITVAATAVALAFATICAFALTRFRIPGRGAVLALVLAISMFPQISIVTPLYQLLGDLGLLDTYEGLTATYIGLALPLMIFVLYGHLRAIPAEIDEAAALDGANRIRTLWSILVPMAAPGIVTATLLGFIANWNEFMLALSFTTTAAHQTIPVGIANFAEQFFIPWGDMAAASVVVTLPLVVLVVIFQRRIVDGISAGAVKG